MAGPAGLTLGDTDAAAASLAQAERLAAGAFRPGMQTPGDTRVWSVRQAASALRAAAGAQERPVMAACAIISESGGARSTPSGLSR